MTPSPSAEVCPECPRHGRQVTMKREGPCPQQVSPPNHKPPIRYCGLACVFPPAPEQKHPLTKALSDIEKLERPAVCSVCKLGLYDNPVHFNISSGTNGLYQWCAPAPPADSDEPPERIKLTPFGDGFICDARTPSMASTAKAGEPIEYARVVGPQEQERWLEFKKRNNQRRDEDKPELREAVDDIYKLLGFLETGRVGRLEAQLQGVMNCLAESQKEVERLRPAAPPHSLQQAAREAAEKIQDYSVDCAFRATHGKPTTAEEEIKRIAAITEALGGVAGLEEIVEHGEKCGCDPCIFSKNAAEPSEDEPCKCHGCGRGYFVDVQVPNALWDRITYPDRPELLCGICIMERIEQLQKFDRYDLVGGETAHEPTR